MYIMHFIEQSEIFDNQVVEVQSRSPMDCMKAYLVRNLMRNPQLMDITAKRLVWADREYICYMEILSDNAMAVRWE